MSSSSSSSAGVEAKLTSLCELICSTAAEDWEKRNKAMIGLGEQAAALAALSGAGKATALRPATLRALVLAVRSMVRPIES